MTDKEILFQRSIRERNGEWTEWIDTTEAHARRVFGKDGYQVRCLLVLDRRKTSKMLFQSVAPKKEAPDQ